MTVFTRFAALSSLAVLFGVACSGADAVPVDQSAPAQSTAALVGPPPATAAPAATGTGANAPGGRGQRLLAKLDTNHDGKIEVSELPERAREHLAAADTNNDGVISRDEFVAFRKERGAERFKKADTNNDGALEQSEVGDKRWAWLSKADANGDGKVTFAEIEQAFKDHKLGFPHRHRGDGAPPPDGAPAPAPSTNQ